MYLYANNSLIEGNKWLPVINLNQVAENKFWVTWEPDKKMYTLLMYDLDAPSASSRANSPYLHWAVTNIRSNTISKGNTLMEYMPPKPGAKSGLHQYVIALYEQSGVLSKRSINARNNFGLESFVAGLKLVDHEVLVVDPDTKQFYLSADPVSYNEAHPLIIGDSKLSDQEQKFCSCIVEVAASLPQECIVENAAFEYRKGHMCYSPFAICGKSVGTSSRMCPANYNFNEMSDGQIEAFANLHHVSLSYPIDRKALFRMFQNH